MFLDNLLNASRGVSKLRAFTLKSQVIKLIHIYISIEIIYIDGVHPQHNSKPSYGWFKKEAKALLKTNSSRQRININGGLNANNLSFGFSR